MTADARKILAAFQALSDGARREVLAELIRLSDCVDYPRVSDDEFRWAANDVFLAYDDSAIPPLLK